MAIDVKAQFLAQFFACGEGFAAGVAIMLLFTGIHNMEASGIAERVIDIQKSLLSQISCCSRMTRHSERAVGPFNVLSEQYWR